MNSPKPTGFRIIPPGKHPGVDHTAKPGDTSNPDIRHEVATGSPKPVLPMDDPRPASMRQPPKAPAPPPPRTSSETLQQIMQEAAGEVPVQESDKTLMQKAFGKTRQELQSEGILASTPVADFIAKLIDQEETAINDSLKEKLDSWIIETLTELHTLSASLGEVGQALDQFELPMLFNINEWQEQMSKLYSVKSIEKFMKIIDFPEQYTAMVLASEIESTFGRSRQLEQEAASAETKKTELLESFADKLTTIADLLKRGSATVAKPIAPSVFNRPSTKQ
jgi:hypothetical protein